jgi:regulator of nonsense transcripts 2
VHYEFLLQRLQDQDRRNHEAYIRSGEIFEDRQQAYEKMTKGYEKLLASCQTYVIVT